MVRKAWIKASNPPTTVPVITPAQTLPVLKAAAKPVTAPMIIIPSTPKFRIPERSVKISPRVAYSSDVPPRTVAARVEGVRSRVKMEVMRFMIRLPVLVQAMMGQGLSQQASTPIADGNG